MNKNDFRPRQKKEGIKTKNINSKYEYNFNGTKKKENAA